jgi:hypothetical protein
MGAARDQMDLGPGTVQSRTDICADGSGTHNSDSHRKLRFSVTSMFRVYFTGWWHV